MLSLALGAFCFVQADVTAQRNVSKTAPKANQKTTKGTMKTETPQNNNQSAAEKAKVMTNKLEAALNLTPDQKGKIFKIVLNSEEALATTDNMRAHPDVIKAKREQIKAERDAKIKTHLRRDQLAKFDSINGDRHKDGMTLDERADRKTKRLHATVNLSEAQQETAKKIFKKSEGKRDELHNKGAIDSPEMTAKMRNIAKEERNAIERVLTPEQAKKWAQSSDMRKERSDKANQQRGNQGPKKSTLGKGGKMNPKKAKTIETPKDDPKRGSAIPAGTGGIKPAKDNAPNRGDMKPSTKGDKDMRGDAMDLTPEKRAERITGKMTKELGLDPKQAKAIESINKNTAEQITGLKDRVKSEAALKRQVAKLNNKRDKKIKSLLNADQVKKYNQMKDQVQMGKERLNK